METDITTYAASYVLVRVAILCAFGYGIFRVLARSHKPATVAMESIRNGGRINGGRVYAVPEDRC